MSKSKAAAIREDGIPDEVAGYVKAGAQDALAFFGDAVAGGSAAIIVNAVDEIVRRWRLGYRPPIEGADEAVNAAWIFGSLWGEQIVREFGWTWAMLTFLEERSAVVFGVVSPDRTLAIYPITILEACMIHPEIDITVMLSFNALQAKAYPELPASGLVNVMEFVRRIVA